MAEALVRSGRWLRWVGSDGRVRDECVIDPRPERVADLLREGLSGLPAPVDEWVRHHPPAALLEASDEPLQEWLAERNIRAVVPSLPELRKVRAAGFRTDREERQLLLAVARRRLERAMRAPEATLSALAREEERVQRVIRRETNAAESWVSEGAPVLSEYARNSLRMREQLTQHLRGLEAALEVQARNVAPNLSAVVGPVVASRLISAAGGLETLSRMDASRLQLLGARRRFGPGRSPRFGILYHGEGMAQVPARWAGAYARSLAALAVIAARADATSGRMIASSLIQRRDRRIAQLKERAG